MKTTEETYDLIDRYLSDQLNEAEKAEFEKVQREDASLRAEVALHRELAESMTEEKVIQFSQLLGNVDKEQFLDTTSEAKIKALFQRIRPFHYISIAAGIALLVSTFLLFQDTPPLSPEALLTDNYEQPRMRLSVRGGEKEILTSKANSAYQSRDFEEVISLLQELQQLDSANSEYPFFEGVSRLNLRQGEEAVQIFDVIINQPTTSRFLQEAQWYRGLAFLEIGAITRAQVAFQEIANDPQHYFYDKAQKILPSVLEL